ncbi:MAG TPA: PadR family transcriptional regulator [Chitinophagales bacterium]|jgi:PadR family transcriptional regulator PadR|nr:PadR family transcriptional regulator [Chitinophagales bacterium]MBP6153349.1 PadR family transcriptional regulator [Chitinophagales bacterium]HQV77426.1 PadR family transcriptional regulator [Chitinophagales bacterium]HQW78488.1 PadR family transcriptional regulator [Chitinophagales bacterium]HRB67685.1 PadR family transcriptional regulator [Chitinophagales bacterium]
MATQQSTAFSTENTKIQMRKGILEFCILGIISRGEVYASDILDALKNANMLVVEGTVYPLLTRLKNAGLLTYEWKESNSGPPRKYFTLTLDGQSALDDLKGTWNELSNAVEKASNYQKIEESN